MKTYQLRFGSRTVTVEGVGSNFTSKFVAAFAAAKSRGDQMPPDLDGMNLREVREFANNVPDSAGESSPVVQQSYGAQDRTYEEEIVASTAVKSKASGAVA